MQFILLLFLVAFYQESTPEIQTQNIQEAATIIGLEFTAEEMQLMLQDVQENLEHYQRLRKIRLTNSISPAFFFTPLVPGVSCCQTVRSNDAIALPQVELPDDMEELAFADISTLAALIRARKISCLQLTEFFLARLKAIDADLHCVITYTEERAKAQARQLDEELAQGKWRGLLHGIPWGAKDLLAVEGYKTTWGAKPYAEQQINEDATVVKKLDAAGAVLIAKLSLGALAWGDVWFGGQTRNPWQPQQGSSGSSAGPAAATAAGGVVFSIGSETYGSIISPSAVCGNSALRPTFGRVSRHGAMSLSWTMDKLGPLCRSLKDAAIVLQVIVGPDELDPTTVDFEFVPAGDFSPKDLRVGYLEQAAKQNKNYARVIEELKQLEVRLVPTTLPSYQGEGMQIILCAEAAAAFDELTRSNQDDLMVRQEKNAWPNVFRASRLIPAVEYIQANRIRTQLILELEQILTNIDVLVHPYDVENFLLLTNLTGHPTAIAPSGFNDGKPLSVCFTSKLYDERTLLGFAQAWQEVTDYHLMGTDLIWKYSPR